MLNRYVQAQRLQASSDGAFQASSDVESKIETMRGGERPLPESERNFFEPRVGVDLSSVRVHTDNTAVQTAKDLGARAYTVGQPGATFTFDARASSDNLTPRGVLAVLQPARARNDNPVRSSDCSRWRR